MAKKNNIQKENIVKGIVRQTLLGIITCYYQIKRFIYHGDLNKKHLSLNYADGKISLTVTDHDSLVKTTQGVIDTMRESDSTKQNERIKFALLESLKGCNYIVFEERHNKNKFLQFLIGNNKLNLIFPVSKAYHLEKYYHSFLGLLTANDFVNKKFEVSVLNRSVNPIKFQTFTVIDRDDLRVVEAHFGKDVELATSFIATFFDKIFKTKTDDICIKVG